MRAGFRIFCNRIFTFGSTMSVVLLVAALAIILGPMIFRGCTAVVFQGTVEFRKMQLDLYGRGDEDAIAAEEAQAAVARQGAYEIIAEHKSSVGFSDLLGPIRQAYKDFKRAQKRDENRDVVRDVVRCQLRDRLSDAVDLIGLHGIEGVAEARKQVAEAVLLCELATLSEDDVWSRLAEIYGQAPAEETVAEFQAHRRLLRGAPIEAFAKLADRFQSVLETEGERLASLRTIEESVRLLFGPPPGSKGGVVIEDKYGATRWDETQRHLENILYGTRYVRAAGDGASRAVQFRRAKQFADTKLAALFPLLESDLECMMRPRTVVYWQYFVDDCSVGHFFGGVGPEIVGTVLVVVLSMAVAVPLGVVAAAYLTEFSKGGPVVRVIRMCVNTLAGVPSIVFGLFGLAFFMLVFLPWFGMKREPSMLAGSLTLAMLVLPVLIRASEEAISAVPLAYKEASLALGAGRLRAFMTVTMPAALPGILTGIILSVSRAAGETAPLLFCAAVAFTKGFTVSPFGQVRTLPYGSYDLAMGDRLAARVPHNQFGMVMTLILVVLMLNLVAIVIRSRVAKRLRGQ